MCVWTDGWKYVGIWGGLQGRVPGTERYFDKVHDWVKVACVSVSVSVSVSVRESAVPGRVQVCVMPNVTGTFNSFECPSIRA